MVEGIRKKKKYGEKFLSNLSPILLFSNIIVYSFIHSMLLCVDSKNELKTFFVKRFTNN